MHMGQHQPAASHTNIACLRHNFTWGLGASPWQVSGLFLAFRVTQRKKALQRDDMRVSVSPQIFV